MKNTIIHFKRFKHSSISFALLVLLALFTLSTLTFATPNPQEVKDLKDKFQAVCGWLSINGTRIEEPIVKGNDNARYLRFNYQEQRASAGAVFMDFRNLGQFYDTHMALYGHYMESGTLFHDLHLYKEAEFFAENPILTVVGLREKQTYQIVSVRIVDADDYYLVLDLKDEALEAYIKYVNRNSKYPIPLPDISAKSTQRSLKMITLVTCSYEFDNARLLIHAIAGR